MLKKNNHKKKKKKRERYQRTSVSFHTQIKGQCRHREEAAVFKWGRASGDTNPDDTLTLNFRSPEPGKTNISRFDHLVSGILLMQPEPTKTSLYFRVWVVRARSLPVISLLPLTSQSNFIAWLLILEHIFFGKWAWCRALSVAGAKGILKEKGALPPGPRVIFGRLLQGVVVASSSGLAGTLWAVLQ